MDEGQRMNILQVDNSDLIGRSFNGHNLQITLNEMGYDSFQAVKYHYGTEKNKYCIRKTIYRVDRVL